MRCGQHKAVTCITIYIALGAADLREPISISFFKAPVLASSFAEGHEAAEHKRRQRTPHGRRVWI
jgi:hypothetical protein